ncbi:MAG: autotransporter assembly complex family protein [Pseudomonadota bacterium]
MIKLFRYADILVVLFCLLISGSLPAAAEGLDYRVELDVPKAYHDLLQNNLDINRWHNTQALNATQLQRLYQAAPDDIRKLLATEGFYSPEITASIALQDKPIQIRFVIVPGLPTQVENIDLSLQGPVEQMPQLRDKLLTQLRQTWQLPVGSVFRQAAWESAKRDALKALLINRFPSARIASSQAVVNPQTRKVILNVKLDSGPAFSFGALHISGLERYPSTIVERLNPIQAGSPYSQAKLLELQARLQDTTYFRSVSVSADTDPAHPDNVPVQVNVVENPSSKLGFGIGVSTDSGLRGQIEYQDLNIMQRGWRFKTLVKLETKQQSLNSELQLPRNDLGYLDSINAFHERTDIEGENSVRSGAGVKRRRNKGRIETTLALQYQIEQQSITGVADNNLKALTLNYIWTYRNVNNPMFPTRGYVFSAQLGGATRALLSDQDFVRGYTRGVYYLPVGQRDGVILRGELGGVMATSRNGIPSDFLFRTGGDQSVRGYSYLSLGVKQADAVVGGRYLAVGSVEYDHWLTERWGVAVFYDVGDAADSIPDLHLVQGYGIGARWKSPVGPLNLDLAYGQAVHAVRLHFSIGVSF